MVTRRESSISKVDVREVEAQTVLSWITDYLETEKRYSGGWAEIEQRAKRSNKTVYDLLCEIENIITYQELLHIFSNHVDIMEATSVDGEILNVEQGRIIFTSNGTGEGRNCYFWHPLAVKGAIYDKQVGQRDSLFLITRELFNRISAFVAVGKTSIVTEENDFSEDVWEVVKTFIKGAIQIGVTDIHLFPVVEKEIYRLRYRILGDLIDVGTFSLPQGKSLVTVIINQAKKDTPSIKVDEVRRPIDGKITIPQSEVKWHHDIDLRVSIMWKPDMTNADVVLRILEKSDIGSNTIEHLGFYEEHVEKLQTAVSRTRGIILVTGATGTGKSKTVNTLLAGLPTQKNIIAIEDPIEYLLPNGRQFQTFEWEENKKREMVGFDELARQCKRHDPDIIFIGELRDRETVETAIHLSKTGHLVLATLHVARATMIPQTLVETYGVSIDALADNLLLGVNQVLAKRLCPKCRQERVMNEFPSWVKKLRFSNNEVVENLRGKIIYEPGADSRCSCAMRVGSELITGYMGRSCVAEVYEFFPGNFESGRLSSFHMEEVLDPSINILTDMVKKIEDGIFGFESLRSLL